MDQNLPPALQTKDHETPQPMVYGMPNKQIDAELAATFGVMPKDWRVHPL